MKLFSGKRIGQSGQELLTAVSFSFILHMIFALAAVLLFAAKPRFFAPPLYVVKLVAPAAEPTKIPDAKPQPQLPPKPAVKPESKVKEKKSAPKSRQADKEALPELDARKPKPAKAGDVQEQPHAASEPAQPVTSTTGEGVAMPTSEDFKFQYYINNLRAKIKPNWKPREGSDGSKARVIFTLNRSGRLLDINLDSEHTTGNFDFKQAAIRAIQVSNPFPQLPDEYPKQTVVFSVDLTPEE